MTPTRLVVALTAWLLVGLVAQASGLVAPEGLGWWLAFGVPGGLYAALLAGGFAASAALLLIALLGQSARR